MSIVIIIIDKPRTKINHVLLTDSLAVSVSVRDGIMWTLAHDGAQRQRVLNSTFLVRCADVGGHVARVTALLVDTCVHGGTVRVITTFWFFFSLNWS